MVVIDQLIMGQQRFSQTFQLQNAVLSSNNAMGDGVDLTENPVENLDELGEVIVEGEI
jgi:hypothetical protein